MQRDYNSHVQKHLNVIYIFTVMVGTKDLNNLKRICSFILLPLDDYKYLSVLCDKPLNLLCGGALQYSLFLLTLM